VKRAYETARKLGIPCMVDEDMTDRSLTLYRALFGSDGLAAEK
jgi:hypothetical protein